MKLAFQFFLALAVGIPYEIWAFAKFKASGLFLSLTGQIPRVSRYLFEKRMDACRRCPIYFAPTGTCGSPFRRARIRGRPYGCLCFMPWKARFEGNCWMWEEIQDGKMTGWQYAEVGYDGWEGALNTDYEPGKIA